VRRPHRSALGRRRGWIRRNSAQHTPLLAAGTFIDPDNLTPFDPSHNRMIQCAGRIHSSVPSHRLSLYISVDNTFFSTICQLRPLEYTVSTISEMVKRDVVDYLDMTGSVKVNLVNNVPESPLISPAGFIPLLPSRGSVGTPELVRRFHPQLNTCIDPQA